MAQSLALALTEYAFVYIILKHDRHGLQAP